MNTTLPQPWFVFRYNHFDPLWRRCWDRDFHDAGRRFVSYRAIEELWIGEAIANSADGVSCFMVECSWVLRHYLDRHPEQREVLRQLAAAGRFELLGSGDNIVDANLIHGELLVRNLVLGTLWADEVLGVRPTTGWHSDGFGSSAQMPQIFRQCGFDWIGDLSYARPDQPFWRGLDGSVVYYDTEKRLTFRQATASRIYQKLPPCPACQGAGCPACDRLGFVIGDRAELTKLPSQPPPGAVGALLLWGEEIQPGRQVAATVATVTDFAIRQGIYRDLRPYLADRLAQVDNPPAELISSKVENNPSQSGCYVSRIKIKQQHRACEHALLAAECWDTLLTAGRSHAALRAAWQQMTLSGFHDSITSSHCDPAYAELCDLHREVNRATTQIATTACRQVLTPAATAVTVFNHTSDTASAPATVELPVTWTGATVTADGVALPVYAVATSAGKTRLSFLAESVPALNARTYRVAPTAAPFQICNEVIDAAPHPVPTPQTTVALAPASPPDGARRAGLASDPASPLGGRGRPRVVPGSGEVKSAPPVTCGAFTAQAGDQGLTDLQVAGLGRVVAVEQFLLGELILEHDVGDPWATRSLDRTRERLGPYTKLRGIERRGDSVVIRYAGRHPSCDDPHKCADPSVTWLTWEQDFILQLGVPWLEVVTRVEWYTHSRRLRLAFPSTSRSDRGIYEIPYGVLDRDRYEGTSINGGNAGGDWPALHWAGVQTPDHTLAVFNQGTPSYRVEAGVVLVSVLRSPQLPYGLYEPESYVANNYHGMTDHGTHTFRHAMCLATGDSAVTELTRQAALFNGGLLAEPGQLRAPLPAWEIGAAHTNLAAVKAAEDGRGIILRFVETAGKPEVVRLRPAPHFRRAFRCNLLEDTQSPLPATAGGFNLSVTPWQIATVRLVTD